MFTGSQAGNELWGQAGSPVAIGIDRHRQRDIVITYRDAQVWPGTTVEVPVTS